MDFLHRSPGQGQWQDIKPGDRNYFQRLAAISGGFVTPGNIVSLLGLGISIAGLVLILKSQFLLAVIFLAVGRLLDVADGYVAALTKTKSPIGEAFDAGIDKLVTFLAVISLVIVEFELWIILAAAILPQIFITVLFVHKARRSIKLHPSAYGKLSMFGLWLGLIGLVIMQGNNHWLVVGLTYLALGLSMVLGLIGLFGYSKVAK